MTFKPDCNHPDYSTEFNPDTDEMLHIDTVLNLADDGATVSIYFLDIPVLDVDGLFQVMGTIEARDDLLMRLAEALAKQARAERDARA